MSTKLVIPTKDFNRLLCCDIDGENKKIDWLEDFTEKVLLKIVDIWPNVDQKYKYREIVYMANPCHYGDGLCYVWLKSKNLKVLLAKSNVDGEFFLTPLFGQEILIETEKEEELIKEWVRAFKQYHEYIISPENFKAMLEQKKGRRSHTFKWILQICDGIRKNFPGSRLAFSNNNIWIEHKGEQIYNVGSIRSCLFCLKLEWTTEVHPKEPVSFWVNRWNKLNTKFKWDVHLKFVNAKSFEEGLPEWFSEEERKECIYYHEKGSELSFWRGYVGYSNDEESGGILIDKTRAPKYPKLDN